ncbi:MAG: ubiquinone biosynthesis regulatory protein kinase UbiB, partial [Burkholderiales bacterium]
DLWATAKPFLERWMMDQIGPRKLLQELRDQAPRFAKILPELPHLIHRRLVQDRGLLKDDAALLIRELKKTNRLLQTMIYGVLFLGLGLLFLLAAPYLF